MKEQIKVRVNYELSEKEFKEKLGISPDHKILWVSSPNMTELLEDKSEVIEIECELQDDSLEFESVENLELM